MPGSYKPRGMYKSQSVRTQPYGISSTASASVESGSPLAASSSQSAAPADLPSKEQREVIDKPLEVGELLKICAVAGAGKTKTLLDLAAARAPAPLLFLAFTTSVQTEVTARCARLGLGQVVVKTIDALALEACRCNHLGDADVADELMLDSVDVEHAGSDVAAAVLTALEVYAASSDDELSDSHVPTAAASLPGGRAAVLRLAERVWARACDWQSLPVASHGVLMKLYAMRYAVLETRFRYVLLDEAHDCTAAQIQAARRIGGSSTILVYDVWQSIYGFRRPIRPAALTAMPCACAYELTIAWRYGEPLASSAASLVRHYARAPDFVIRGNPARSTAVEEYSDAAALLTVARQAHRQLRVIGSTNFSLLLAAADLLRMDALCTVGFASGGAFVYMVGMHDQRTFMRELVSFYSGTGGEQFSIPVFQHFAAAPSRRDRFMSWAGSAAARSTQERDGVRWDRVVELVQGFPGSALSETVELLLARSTGPEGGVLQLITAHRAKGLSWAHVALLDSFMLLSSLLSMEELAVSTAARLRRDAIHISHGTLLGDPRRLLETACTDADRRRELVSVLYVAMTRAEQRLLVPPSVMRWLRGAQGA
jgi:hypothetical protein